MSKLDNDFDFVQHVVLSKNSKFTVRDILREAHERKKNIHIMELVIFLDQMSRMGTIQRYGRGYQRRWAAHKEAA